MYNFDRNADNHADRHSDAVTNHAYTIKNLEKINPIIRKKDPVQKYVQEGMGQKICACRQLKILLDTLPQIIKVIIGPLQFASTPIPKLKGAKI